MTTMTLRLDDVDAQIVRKYAKFEGKSISDFIRDAIFERIADEEDLATLRQAIEEDDGVRYSHADVLKELGL
ncbi:MAG: CopG family transcriptional regulator [Eggerthellaceae bacterium]|nr:CopG family transcriptional regulator [Eggerthellaceae bacterium]